MWSSIVEKIFICPPPFPPSVTPNFTPPLEPFFGVLHFLRHSPPPLEKSRCPCVPARQCFINRRIVLFGKPNFWPLKNSVLETRILERVFKFGFVDFSPCRDRHLFFGQNYPFISLFLGAWNFVFGIRNPKFWQYSIGKESRQQLATISPTANRSVLESEKQMNSRLSEAYRSRVETHQGVFRLGPPPPGQDVRGAAVSLA